MKKKHIVSAMILLLVLGGCTIKLKPPIEIEINGGGKQCPPGQAKKGRC